MKIISLHMNVKCTKIYIFVYANKLNEFIVNNYCRINELNKYEGPKVVKGACLQKAKFVKGPGLPRSSLLRGQVCQDQVCKGAKFANRPHKNN